jgi:hypothetical protein
MRQYECILTAKIEDDEEAGISGFHVRQAYDFFISEICINFSFNYFRSVDKEMI